ncbi:hypothetical protein IFR04_011645 [Cadophora malorum]|uniref:Uncharacterized protein n=1 Tax=Cadophora malorum TaxID=108018 RepID=A0A8H7T4X6_9HELO|nr:hypothetical protein IFR04_011645 [Cadophora malorum]
MITEIGVGNGTQCQSYLTDIITYMKNNPEYIGWTAWAAGPFWGSARPCCTDSKQYGSLEPGSKGADGSPGLYTTIWVNQIQKLLPKALVWKGVTSLTGGL